MWSSINVSLDPNLKHQLLNHELTDMTCEKCGNVSTLQYSLLYHDMEIPTAIWLVYPRDDTPETAKAMKEFSSMVSAEYKLRIVHSMDELIEKVVIFDCGLNDLAIQLLKFNFLESDQRATPGPWFFHEVVIEGSEKRLAFSSSNSSTSATIPMTTGYHDLAMKLKGLENSSQWVYVNSESAMLLLESSL